jgi:hypothetical protein
MVDRTVDWFVAADSKFGDGSRDNPFHDPRLAVRCAGPSFAAPRSVALAINPGPSAPMQQTHQQKVLLCALRR